MSINFSNGLSNLLVKFGLIGFFLYFIIIGLSIKKFTKINSKNYFSIIVLGIVIFGFSEPLLETHLLFAIQYFILCYE